MMRSENVGTKSESLGQHQADNRQPARVITDTRETKTGPRSGAPLTDGPLWAIVGSFSFCFTTLQPGRELAWPCGLYRRHRLGMHYDSRRARPEFQVLDVKFAIIPGWDGKTGGGAACHKKKSQRSNAI